MGHKSYILMYQGWEWGRSQELHSYVSGVGVEQVESAVVVAFVGRIGALIVFHCIGPHYLILLYL